MGKYKPPFTITNKILSYVSSISEKIGRITATSSLESKPHLRKNNRIRSIHSSLKIEANSLSLGQVRDVVNGKLVLGEQKEIQEVKNAYAAYEKISEIDPYSISELKKYHGIMTKYVVEESGSFRQGEEGVFKGDRCIFMAPPARMVPQFNESTVFLAERSKGQCTSIDIKQCFSLRICFHTSVLGWEWKNGTLVAYGISFQMETGV